MTKAVWLTAALQLISGVLWLSAEFGLIEIPRPATTALQGAFLLFCAVSIALDWSDRTGRPIKEPSPATSIALVVGSTGITAAIVTAMLSSAGAYAVPAAIIVGTLLASAVAYWLAARHAHKIGEARFKPTVDTGRPEEGSATSELGPGSSPG